MAGAGDWNSSAARYGRGEISVQDYMMASSDEEEAESDWVDESDDVSSNDGGDESGMPERLRRLFKTEDIRKRYGLDWKDLPWSIEDLGFGDTWGTGDLTSPPPPDDPRTHLPRIFKFNGWDRYKLPDFTIRSSHPPQYPSELVSRLRQLHDSGAALQRQDGLEYVVVCHDFGSDQDESSDDYEECDSDEELHSNGKPALDDKDDEVLGRYETLEQANDRAMQEVERDHKNYMQYEGPEPDGESLPDVGLYSFVHKDQEGSLQFGDEGLTWDIDNAGCIMFCALDGGARIEYVVEKRQMSTATRRTLPADRKQLPAE